LIGEISKGMAAISEDLEAGMKDNDDIFAFLKAVNAAAEEGREDFTCPICGGSAHWARSEYNGHISAKCDKCKIRVME
jgi:hypothetical protein